LKVGPKPKEPMSDSEFEAVKGLFQTGRYRGGGMRAAANLVSALRGANEAMTPKAKARRTVSARWVGRELEKRGKIPSAAKLQILKRQAIARRNSEVAGYSGSRIPPEYHASQDLGRSP